VSPALARFVTWLPRIVRREFRTRGGDTRFLIWVSFLAAFLWARVWVTYFAKVPPVGVENVFEMGGKTVIFGYHPHHIVTGILFVAIAGFVGLHYKGVVVTRIAAVLYGSGLGLIVDQAGLIVSGITYRNDHPEMFVLVVTISAWMMSTIYFPSFWKTVDGKLARVYSRVSTWVFSLRHPEDPVQRPVPVIAAATAEPTPETARAPDQ
jgi:hypothetical protein